MLKQDPSIALPYLCFGIKLPAYDRSKKIVQVACIAVLHISGQYQSWLASTTISSIIIFSPALIFRFWASANDSGCLFSVKTKPS
jgi:hypothetical protein